MHPRTTSLCGQVRIGRICNVSGRYSLDPVLSGNHTTGNELRRRGPRPQPTHATRQAPEIDVDREDHDPDEEGLEDVGSGGVAVRHMPERPPASRPVQPQPQRAGLSRDDAERLQATLVELLELKRLLDQAR